jgi:hypothetical protein
MVPKIKLWFFIRGQRGDDEQGKKMATDRDHEKKMPMQRESMMEPENQDTQQRGDECQSNGKLCYQCSNNDKEQAK